MSTLSNSSRKLWWLILVLLFLIVPTLTFSKGGPGIGVLINGTYYSDIGDYLSGISSSINDSAGNGDTTVTWSADKVFDQLALKQAADADLTTYAGITPSANIQSLLGSADYSAARTNLGVTWTNLGGKPATPGAASLLLHGADGTLANAASFDLALTTNYMWVGVDSKASAVESTGTGAPVRGTGPTINGSTLTGVHDAGSATSFEIPNSDDPDVGAAGQVSWDTDGWLRAYDGTNQVAVGRKIVEINVTVIKPNDLADATRDAFLFWSNESGMSFVITGWKGWSSTDNTTFNIETTTADGQNNATVDAVELATDGTGVYTGADTTITAGTIANGSLLWLDFDDIDDPGWVKLTIYGYYNADVN